MQKLLSKFTAAIETYNMIDEGDNIAVGVSGGKDSMVLLMLLNELSKFYYKKFTVTAITLDMGFPQKCDYSPILNFCNSNNIKYHIKNTNLYNIIFNTRKEKNPCSLCSKMRRGILHNMTVSLNCNKIALGHHLNDAAETFMMNLTQNGRIKCFSPVSYLSRKNIHMIRPMIFINESEIINFINKTNLYVLKSQCPADKTGSRNKTKELISKLEVDYNGLSDHIINALQKENINGWGKR